MVEGLTRETLKRLYIKEGKSLVKIAEIFSCSPATVRNRCVEYGIKTREPKRIKGIAKVLQASYYDKVQLEKLDRLSAKTRVPKAVFLREGLDLVLGKYGNELKGKHKRRKRR